MKNIIALFTAFILSVTLMACSGSANPPDTPNEAAPLADIQEHAFPNSQQTESAQINMLEKSAEQSRVLVAYFSWAENAVLNPDVDAIASASVTSPGNVAQLAGWVQDKTGGDLFSIRVTEPYSSDWDECLDRANQEKGSNARPELAESVENMDDYDVVFLGYPNWWYSAPMAIFSFLEGQDLSGKTVYLFCSHGTGGLASSVRDISAALPNSAISENVFDVNEEDAASSQEAIENWLGQLGY